MPDVEDERAIPPVAIGEASMLADADAAMRDPLLDPASDPLGVAADSCGRIRCRA